MGIFRKIKGQIDREYQGGINQKGYKVAGGLCPGITIITKDISQHNVAVPNNRFGN